MGEVVETEPCTARPVMNTAETSLDVVIAAPTPTPTPVPPLPVLPTSTANIPSVYFSPTPAPSASATPLPGPRRTPSPTRTPSAFTFGGATPTQVGGTTLATPTSANPQSPIVNPLLWGPAAIAAIGATMAYTLEQRRKRKAEEEARQQAAARKEAARRNAEQEAAKARNQLAAGARYRAMDAKLGRMEAADTPRTRQNGLSNRAMDAKIERMEAVVNAEHKTLSVTKKDSVPSLYQKSSQYASQSVPDNRKTFRKQQASSPTALGGFWPIVVAVVVVVLVAGGIYLRYRNVRAVNNDPIRNQETRDSIGGALVTEYNQVILEQSIEHNVPSALIASVVRHESGAAERRFLGSGWLANVAEFLEATVRTPFGNGASIGIGQIQVQRAQELEDDGYVSSSKNRFDRIERLLTPADSIQYIAGNLEYYDDLLTTTYGSFYSSLNNDTRYRLMLIGYNEGWDSLSSKIDTVGVRSTIEMTNYDDLTLDAYQNWLEANK